MIKLIKSTFYKEKQTKEALIKFIKKAKILSFNGQCLKFEKKFSKFQKRKYTVFLNSGSSANLALIQALLNLGYLKKGDLIGFSALTWSTNVMPLIQLGLIPVPVDVELNTLNVSSKKLKEVLNKFSLKAFFLTNLLGFCDDVDNIKKLCEEKRVILIEDNCESLGTIYKGKLLGNFGLASTFSFYVGHHMSTIEGGAVCTDNKDLATMLKIVRAHGWDRNLSIREQKRIRKKFNVNYEFYSRYTFYDLGFNLRSTEINGFLGNYQLQFLDEIIKKRNENFMKIAKIIYENKDYYPIKYNHIDFVSNFAIPVVCKSKSIRDKLVEKCKNKVEVRPIVGGDMTQQLFFTKYGGIFKNYLEDSNSKIIHDQGLYFGNNPELTDEEINTIIKVFS